MNREQLAQMFLDEWKKASPKVFRAQDPAFLKTEALALADRALAEIKAVAWPGQQPEQVWSEVAGPFLATKCPQNQSVTQKA